MFQDRYWCNTRAYHIPLPFQCTYGHSDERGENGDEEDKSDIYEGGERVKIILYADDLIVWQIRRRSKGNGGMFC